MGKLRDKLVNWVNNFINEEPDTSGQIDFVSSIMEQQQEALSNYPKPKTQIEYWKSEIAKYTRFISDARKKLANEDFLKSLTPKKYDQLKASIEKALYSLEFSQQSLEKVLIMTATSKEEISQLKTEALTKFRNQKEENDKNLARLGNLQDYIDMYSARKDIFSILTQIQSCKDEDEKAKLFESLKSKYELLKNNFSKRGNPENAALLDQQFEDLLNGDTNFRNDFLKKTSVENLKLIEGLKGSAKSILGYSSDKSFESISKLLEFKLKEAKDESKTLNTNINFLSDVSDEKAIYLLTLTLYSSLYNEADKVAGSIKNIDYSNYSLSEKIQKKIEESKDKSPSSILTFFRDNFSEDILDQKRELAIAMYPFLAHEENESKLEEYISENNKFLNKLINSGITPEELIEEQENAELLKNDKMCKIIEAALDTIRVTSTKKLHPKISTYNAVKDTRASFFKLDKDLLIALKTLPKKDPEVSKASYMKQLAMHLSDVSKGEAERIPEVYSISNMHLRTKIGRADAVDEFTRVISGSENASSEIYDSGSEPESTDITLDDINVSIAHATKDNPENASSKIYDSESEPQFTDITLDDIKLSIAHATKDNPGNASFELDNSGSEPQFTDITLDDIKLSIAHATNSTTSSEFDAINASIAYATGSKPENTSFSKPDIDAEIAKIIRETEKQAKEAIDKLIRGGRDDD